MGIEINIEHDPEVVNCPLCDRLDIGEALRHDVRTASGPTYLCGKGSDELCLKCRYLSVAVRSRCHCVGAEHLVCAIYRLVLARRDTTVPERGHHV